ncbi:MAG: hypothetical protein IT385_31160 [Deltaproteobacteria bacterium]|nr:hypothetical protein [Deltaproteobacteria bacterium]
MESRSLDAPRRWWLLGRATFVFLFAGLIAQPSGCTSSSEPESETLRLRPGFQAIYRSQIPARRANGALGHEGQAFLVTDASVAGGRIVLAGYEISYSWGPTWHSEPFDPDAPLDSSGSGGGGVGAVGLFVSDDDARTWRRQALTPAAGEPAPLVMRMGVAAHGEHTTAGMFFSGPAGKELWFTELDVATGVYRRTQRAGDAGLWEVRDGTLVGHGFASGYHAQLYDIDTHTARGAYGPFASPSDPTALYTRGAWARFDGHALMAVATRQEPPESCVVRYLLAEATVDADGHLALEEDVAGCVSFDDLDPTFLDVLLEGGRFPADPGAWLVWYRDALFTPYEADGHVWLYGRNPLSGSASSAPIDLGPGEIGAYGFGMFHAGLDGMLGIVDPTSPDRSTRFLAFPHATGSFIEADIPQTPCVVDADCGDARVTAVRYIPGGRVLVVYDVRTDAHQYVVVGTVPSPLYRPLPDPGEPVRGSATEHACARMASCFPEEMSAGLLGCVSHWLSRRGGALTDVAYQAFLAVERCEDYPAVYPLLAGSLHECSVGGGCLGTMAVRCFEGGGIGVVDCRERGVACEVRADGNGYCGPLHDCSADPHGRRCEGDVAVACYGSEQQITDCAALGLECRDGACADLAAIPCEESLPLCRGEELLRTCGAASLEAASFYAPGDDCARLDLTCDAGSASCVAAVPQECLDDHNVACDGTQVVYCVGGELRGVHCADIGWRTCETDTFSVGHCVP